MNWNKVKLRAKDKNLPKLNEAVLWATCQNAPSEGIFYKFTGWLSNNGKYIETKTEKYELTDNFWWCEIPDPVVNEQLVTVEDFWGKEHKARLVSKPDEPYLVYEYVEKHVEKRYNPNYGDDRMCVCGHPYYRHFDSYDHMEAVGCKYCGCQKFIEKKENEGE